MPKYFASETCSPEFTSFSDFPGHKSKGITLLIPEIVIDFSAKRYNVYSDLSDQNILSFINSYF